ncbi:MAG: polysaccharide pyruvyl transferase family protein [Bacteroidales bacterium]|nr:polysaccharide pyruvyl transferase family protein [Bacteroidales bacterium]
MRVGLYSHGGSGNHGCEALARSSMRFLGENEYTILSERPEDDSRYGLDTLAHIEPSRSDMPKGLGYLAYSLKMKLRRDDKLFWRKRYRGFDEKIRNLDIALSIGGDNYCYNGFVDRFSILNRAFVKRHIPIVLWGCSIDEDRLSRRVIEDLRLFSLIVARESITFDALRKAGLDNVRLMPDVAFLLDPKDVPLPEGFLSGNMVGLNISPLIIRHETASGSVMRACKALIDYILDETDMGVALIPHVNWYGDDDRVPLGQLFKEYRSSGRVVMIEDADAASLKGVIRKCRFMVASRTHASIAAYSTGVPTLVIGYSVKSRGIAKDLLGTEDHYVLPVEDIKEGQEIEEAFKWIVEREAEIRSYYNSHLEDYIGAIDKDILNGRV